MKIGLNATCIGERASGARQRFLGLYGAVVRCMPQTEFVLYEPADACLAPHFAGLANVCVQRTPVPSAGRMRKLLRGWRYWPPALRAARCDIFEMFNLPALRAPTGRTLLTVHDVRQLRPQAGRITRGVHTTVLAQALRAADHLITVSQAMKEELLASFPGSHISVVPNGVATDYARPPPAARLQSVQRRYALPQQFALAVGHFEARKNYLRLIEAMALLRDRGEGCPLVIVGNDSGMQPQVAHRIATAGLQDCVTLLCNLDDQELRCLYALSSLFVFPSEYEGFGIPVLEAMAAGIPMVLSDIPVFREITEHRGVYFRPDSAEAMADAIARVLTDSGERERLIAYGAQRVHAFSFQQLAARLARLYHELS